MTIAELYLLLKQQGLLTHKAPSEVEDHLAVFLLVCLVDRFDKESVRIHAKNMLVGSLHYLKI